MKRAKQILRRGYVKGFTVEKEEIIKLLNHAEANVEAELLEDGKLEDGTEFTIFKIFAKRK